MSNDAAKKPIWKRLLGGAFYATFLLTIFGAATLFGWLSKSKTAGKLFVAQILNQHEPVDKVFNHDSVNILLLGCDVDLSPGGKKVLKQQARSDMMLLAKLDFKHDSITGVSIPRDTLYRLKGYREQKINAYHSIGGDALTKRAVEGMLDVKIDRVVAIDYEALKDLVDSIGGVDIYIDKRMKYDDDAGGLHIDFKPGRQVLNGYDAMCYVRFRHSDTGNADTDFVRQDRQKRLLMAFKDRMMQRWDKLPEVLERTEKVLSNALTSDELVALTYFARTLDQDNIRMGQIPVVDGPGYSLRIDRSKLKQTLREFNLAATQSGRVTYAR